MTVINILRLLF